MKKLLFLMILFFAVSACDVQKNEYETSNDISNDPVEILDPWFRPAVKGANTALFFNFSNTTDSALVITGASSDLAKLTEVHETYQREGDMMGMRHIDSVVVEPSSTFNFKPGAHHIMLINLNNDLNIGDSAKITLEFRNHKNIEISAEVKDLMEQ